MKKDLLGKKAKDKITGFTGIITGHARYLTGCDQYILQPECDTDHRKYPDANWFDEGRIEVLEGVITKEDVKGEKNGCDYSAPIK